MPRLSTSATGSSPSPHSAGEFALVFAADDAYARTTAVALRTALRHLDQALGVETYVLDNGLTHGSRGRLNRVSAAVTGCQLRWLEIPPERLVDTGHLHPTTYARLLLPELMPTSVTRAVYLDGDVIVRDDLSHLFALNLGTASFAVTRDFASPRSDSESPPDEVVKARPFFNPGVLVVNLRQWRSNGFAERALEYARAAEEPLPFGDQDAMNAVATADDWLELDLRWNVQVGLMYRPELPRTELTEFLYRNREQIYRDAAIIHFNAIPKPWHPWSFGTSKGKTLWGLELIRSGWYRPTESLKWAVPWVGRRVVDSMRRSKPRASSLAL